MQYRFAVNFGTLSMLETNVVDPDSHYFSALWSGYVLFYANCTRKNNDKLSIGEQTNLTDKKKRRNTDKQTKRQYTNIQTENRKLDSQTTRQIRQKYRQKNEEQKNEEERLYYPIKLSHLATFPWSLEKHNLRIPLQREHWKKSVMNGYICNAILFNKQAFSLLRINKE